MSLMEGSGPLDTVTKKLIRGIWIDGEKKAEIIL